MTKRQVRGVSDPNIHSGPIGVAELTRCCLVVALINLTPLLAELALRWRRTLLYVVAIAAYSVVLVVATSLPVYLAPLAAWATFVVAITVAMTAVTMRRRRDITVWRAWSGAAGAVCMIEWNPRRSRHEAHSLAAFPRGRHLGQPVATPAVSHGPRPIWVEPAVPGLRSMYRSRYGFVDDSRSRWMILE